MIESMASELDNSRLFIRDYNSNCKNILKEARKNYADPEECKKGSVPNNYKSITCLSIM